MKEDAFDLEDLEGWSLDMEREKDLFYWFCSTDLKLDLLLLWISASFFSKNFLKAGEAKSFLSSSITFYLPVAFLKVAKDI